MNDLVRASPAWQKLQLERDKLLMTQEWLEQYGSFKHNTPIEADLPAKQTAKQTSKTYTKEKLLNTLRDYSSCVLSNKAKESVELPLVSVDAQGTVICDPATHGKTRCRKCPEHPAPAAGATPITPARIRKKLTWKASMRATTFAVPKCVPRRRKRTIKATSNSAKKSPAKLSRSDSDSRKFTLNPPSLTPRRTAFIARKRETSFWKQATQEIKDNGETSMKLKSLSSEEQMIVSLPKLTSVRTYVITKHTANTAESISLQSLGASAKFACSFSPEELGAVRRGLPCGSSLTAFPDANCSGGTGTARKIACLLTITIPMPKLSISSGFSTGTNSGCPSKGPSPMRTGLPSSSRRTKGGSTRLPKRRIELLSAGGSPKGSTPSKRMKK